MGIENAVGFDWNSYKSCWEEMFKRLLAYKGENGDCNVRSSYSDKQLPIWIYAQRGSHKKGTFAPEYVERLNAGRFCVEPP